MQILTNAGCNPTARNSGGETVLEAALGRGYTSVVEHLLSCNVPFPPDVLPIALWRRSALWMVEFLVRKGADVHSTSFNGHSVLHLAIARYPESTCLDLVQSFTDTGCNPTTCNSRGETVLEAAIGRGYTSVVEYLLSCNALFPPDALPIALRRRSTPWMVKFLIHKGADVHSTSFNGDSVLHLAIAGYLESTCLDLVQIFINAGCNPTARNFKDETVLEAALGRGYTSVMEHLLSCNVPFPPDALPIALWKSSTPWMVEFLIRKGADVHSTSSNGDSVLHLAIVGYPELTCLSLVLSFIDAGCNPTAYNSRGKTVLEAAIECGYILVVEHLLSCNVPFPPDALPIALWKSSTLRMVKFLIHKGADVHSTNSDGDSVLHLAIAGYLESTCLDLVQIFINAGCNPTACNSGGETVLEAAIKRGYTTVVEHLLSCNVSVPPDVLPIALRQTYSPQMIECLVRRSVKDATMESEFHWDTLLQHVYALYSGQDRQQVIDILDAARKAKTARPSPEDETPIHVAKRPRLG